MNKWTHDEIRILKSNLHLTNKQLLRFLPNKSIDSIKYKCRSLSLRKKSKFSKFSTQEIKKFLDNIELRDRLTGHLLGDGSLNSDISFSLRNTHKDYVIELQYFFNKLTDRENKISIIPSYIRLFNNGILSQCKESYSSTFTCARMIRPMKSKWYNKLGKTIPRDTILSPLVCNRWYCDDGNLYIGKGSLRITLYTDGFQAVDIEFLISSLKNTINITPQKKIRQGRQTKQYSIVIKGKDALLFLKYIQIYPVDSFAYKWDTKGYKILHANCKYCKQDFQYTGFVSYRKACCNCQNTRVKKCHLNMEGIPR